MISSKYHQSNHPGLRVHNVQQVAVVVVLIVQLVVVVLIAQWVVVVVVHTGLQLLHLALDVYIFHNGSMKCLGNAVLLCIQHIPCTCN